MCSGVVSPRWTALSSMLAAASRGDHARDVDERSLRTGDGDALVDPQVDRRQDQAAVDRGAYESGPAGAGGGDLDSLAGRAPQPPEPGRAAMGHRRAVAGGQAGRDDPLLEGRRGCPAPRRPPAAGGPAGRLGADDLICSALSPSWTTGRAVTRPNCSPPGVAVGIESTSHESQSKACDRIRFCGASRSPGDRTRQGPAAGRAARLGGRGAQRLERGDRCRRAGTRRTDWRSRRADGGGSGNVRRCA